MTPALFASIVVVSVGVVIFWSNTAHRLNRLIFSSSCHIAIWLVFFHLATTAGIGGEGLEWLRWATSISALIPFHFWLFKEAIASDKMPAFRQLIWRFFLGLLLGSVCFTEYFIPSHSTDNKRIFGVGYYIYIVGVLFSYAELGIDGFNKLKELTGGRRLALQVWLGGGCTAAATIIALMLLNAITHDRRLIVFQPIVVMIFYAATTFAITTYKIFDARQILIFVTQKAVTICVVLLLAFGVHTALIKLSLPEAIVFSGTVVSSLWIASEFNRWLNNSLQFYPQAMAARQAAFAVARRDLRVEDLENLYVSIIKGWGNAESAVLLCGGKDGLKGNGVVVAPSSLAIGGLRRLRWVTPERLAREKATPERLALSEFLAANRLGILVLGEGPTLTVVAGVGSPASRRPFTFPQVGQLMELTSIMESAFERAHFSVKAQHAEQLATVGLMGASLAHEIRNPLVSIKTFVQLLPSHHNDPQFREKFFRLITEEVGRIDRLTEQLLDLASPRAYTAEKTELHPVLHASLELVAAKAAGKNIELRTKLGASPDVILTDPSSAKQVIINLCLNAIQAIEDQPGVRWIELRTEKVLNGVEVVVEDNGAGISEEIRSKLFQPFHSTKSTGFGLGLAICKDILNSLNATITLDPHEVGKGARFRVTFPCPALSSS